MKKIYSKSSFIYKLNPCIDKGSYGKIFKINDNLCVKLFEYKNLQYKADQRVLCLIKKLKLSNFYEIYDLLYDDNGIFIGYVMRYYEKEDIDLITVPIEYILKNIKSLYNSIKILSKKKVYIDDMLDYNTIVNKDAIIIIDTDFYSFSNFFSFDTSKKFIFCNNIKILIEMIKRLFYLSLEKYHTEIKTEYYDIIADLCTRLEEKNGIDAFCNSLEGYKYMIDYVRKKTR